MEDLTKVENGSFAWVRVQLVKDYGPTYRVQDASRPEKAVWAAWSAFDGADREKVVVLCLDSRLRVNAAEVVAIGSLDTAPVNPRETFTSALLRKAASIVVLHNHPSGDVEPSAQDIAVSRRLARAGEILGIRLEDFIVVGDTPALFYSFRAHGLLETDLSRAS